MPPFVFLKHLLFAFSLFILSLIIVRLMLYRIKILDIPNERSSHEVPIPKSGGIAIVVTFFIGMLMISLFAKTVKVNSGHFYSFFLSALLVAGISFYDDIKEKSFTIKLLAQIVAVILTLASGIVIDKITWPLADHIFGGWWLYPISFLWILGMTNAFNFMDGLDGLAGGVALIVSLFFCIITFLQGSHLVYIMSYTIIAGTLGFLLFNFPPARIFMGDVGSAFLGFTFACLAIIAANYDRSHTPLFVMPLLLFNFIYDTAFTFIRRLICGEKVTEAHRTHLYQLFQQLGYSHGAVSLFHYGLCILQGFAAYWMVNIPGDTSKLFVFLPIFTIQVIYTVLVMRAAKKAGLI